MVLPQNIIVHPYKNYLTHLIILLHTLVFLYPHAKQYKREMVFPLKNLHTINMITRSWKPNDKKVELYTLKINIASNVNIHKTLNRMLFVRNYIREMLLNKRKTHTSLSLHVSSSIKTLHTPKHGPHKPGCADIILYSLPVKTFCIQRLHKLLYDIRALNVVNKV